MKLPEGVISISLFLCEKTLMEQDSVLSAIRIVDVFPVRGVTTEKSAPPLIRIFGCALVKAKPGPPFQFKARFQVADEAGHVVDIGPPMDLPIGNKNQDQSLPMGGSIAIELNIEARTFGTSYLCFCLDEAEVSRTPFTIVPLPEPKQQAQ
jgi:hypothetical protein